MRRIRLKTVMIAIGVLAVLLGAGIGLDRRSRRLEALALRHGREANRLENLWTGPGPFLPGEQESLMDRTHWNDSVANAYRLAAARPWLLSDPDLRQITCECGHHGSRKVAGTN